MEILYRDDRVVVCVKPSGVLSTDEPGGMPERLREELGAEQSVRSVHRLDRAVGGVMVYALTRRAASDLGRQIREGSFRKEYLAAVHGRPSPAAGTLRDFLHRDTARRITRLVPAGSPEAQEAVLDYALLEERDGLSLLRVRLHTGRAHQIRCQLAGHGWPILGDRKYGAPDGEEAIALWSHKLAIMHPRTNERMDFSRRPPDIFPWNLFSADNFTE